MTEQEAIKILNDNYPLTCKMVDGQYKGGFKNFDSPLGKAIAMAISALEEIQQYRALGTVEHLKDMKENYAEALSDWRYLKK